MDNISYETMIVYETWYDFFYATALGKGTVAQRVIRERTVVIEPSWIHKEPISFVPRTTVLTRPYYKAALLFPRNDKSDTELSLSVGYEDGDPVHRVEILQAPERGYVARYVEHLYYPDRSNETGSAKHALPLLYVSRTTKENSVPASIMFVVNVPLAAYHISPPPFRSIVEKSKCSRELPKEIWHTLVFKRAFQKGASTFDLDCEESIRVKSNFMKFIVLEKYWRLNLYVPQPKKNRTYGIYIPLPLMGFIDE